MSDRWARHMTQFRGLMDAQPAYRYAPPPAPVAPPVAEMAPTVAEAPWWQTGAEFGGPSHEGRGPDNVAWSGGFPNAHTLASAFDVNPGAARAGLATAGLLSGPLGMGIGALNTLGNVANTAQNQGMLHGLGVNPGLGSTLGGLLGFNGLAGSPTSALNAAMANQYGGFANMSSPQFSGDLAGPGGWGGWADIAAAMDAANAQAGSAYEGQGPGQAVQGEVTAEPLAELPGFRRGGYTGAGRDGKVQPNRIAGVVHEGEYVVPHWMLRAWS